MTVVVPFSPPFAEPTPNTIHAVSVSMPSWESVIAWAKREKWMLRIMPTGYPRFFIHPTIQSLGYAVLQRIGLPQDGDILAMLFVNEQSAARCAATINLKNTDGHQVEIVGLRLPSGSKFPSNDARWLSFYAVLYHSSLDKVAKGYWRDSGDGISSRHALFYMERLDYLESNSTNRAFCTPHIKSFIEENPPPPLSTTGVTESNNLKKFIAKLSTSESPDGPIVNPKDVFLFPRGMNAIYTVSRALCTMESPSKVVAYGWLYAETTKVIERTNWDKFDFYGHGRQEDLDDLEASLKAGNRIQALFCEFPGNPLLVSPDLKRIKALAQTYNFIVICDETVATWVNVDILPDVDITVTSLTKMFSGYCDVMGGCAVINPKSRYYDVIHSRLTDAYEDTFFPLDLVVLNKNSADFVPRAHEANKNAKLAAEYMAKHPSVASLKYPSMGPTASLYEKYRRREGGYGHLLSIVFHEERSAIIFYNSLDVCKGTSFGTNFSLAIPYVQLAHYFEQDWVESYGVSRHIIRLSVGLESSEEILKAIARAFEKVEQNKLA